MYKIVFLLLVLIMAGCAAQTSVVPEYEARKPQEKSEIETIENQTEATQFGIEDDNDAETKADTVEIAAPQKENQSGKQPEFQYGTTPRFISYNDPPQPIYNPRPKYTVFARRSGIEGRVVLNVEVFADGTVGAVEVVQSLMPGPGGLDEAAVRAIRQWEFEPAKSGGKPVSVWITFPIEFRLN